MLDHRETSIDYVGPDGSGLRHLVGAVASRLGIAPLFRRARKVETVRSSRLGILAGCRTLDPTMTLKIGRDVVARLYGSSTQAVADLGNDLGDPMGQRYAVRPTNDGGLTVTRHSHSYGSRRALGRRARFN